MKIVRFIVLTAITSLLVYFLNTGTGKIPALGKFLNPISGFWANSENSFLDKKESKINSSDLLAAITVHYDDNAVPHIFAQNDHDLYWAQGYVTAQDRLWQMEFQTHFAAGRLSEIVGDAALENDRYQRKMGAVYGAEKSLEGMIANPKIKVALDAYAKGVNAFISSLSEKDLPLEYKLLGYKPEPWTTLKSALFLKNMSFVLAAGSNELAMTNFVNQFGINTAENLFPNFLAEDSPIIPKGTKIDFKPMALPKFKNNFDGQSSNKITQERDKGLGSNNWAIAGSKSATGLPILANDPHLTLSLPSIWYHIQMHAPGVNVYGNTMPGSPMVIAGFNKDIAWGVTNVGADVMDWYEVRFKDNKQNEYWHNNQWKKVIKRVETIKVKGKEAVTDTVIYTHHGPVVYLGGQKVYKDNVPVGHALKWIAHEKSEELTCFYELNRAKNYDDYVNALSYFAAPAQNFVFASNQNDIALWVNGRFPLKAKQQGKYILDGSDATHDWAGYIPHAQNPHVKNPARGFVSSANQSSTGAEYPYYINWAFASPERGLRINEKLQNLTKATADSLRLLQNDNFNILARKLLPFLLKNTTISAKNKEAVAFLTKWNLQNDALEIAPTIFEEWVKNLSIHIWDDELKAKPVPVSTPYTTTTTQLILANKQSVWFDNIKTTNKKETLQDIINESLIATIDTILAKKQSLKNAPWYSWKATSVKHLLGSTNKAFDKFNTLEMNMGGGARTVNATNIRTGPSMRMVVELDKNEPKAMGIYPGGQSGNAGSKYYNNMIEKFTKGELLPLLYLKEATQKNKRIIKTMTIAPKQ